MTTGTATMFMLQRDALAAECAGLRRQLERAVEGRENANAVSVRVEIENRRLHESRARWIKCFNRLEKAVTNHIDNCIDADDLAHAHKAVMRDLGPHGEQA